MHEGKILLVKLSAKVESVSSLIGSLMIALLLNAAYNRPLQRRQFHLYADEFQRFATEDFATLLEEARKFGIGTTIAHQNRGQLNSTNSKLATNLKDRSRSVGNMVVFKINSKDAEDLAGEFQITPQEAWEEELEEEWVEVLKEEWYERKEEEITDGREPRLVPTRDGVHHLLTHGHPDQEVAEFITDYLRELQHHAQVRVERSRIEVARILPVIQRYRNGMSGSDMYQYDPEVVANGVEQLNTLMYQVMTGDHDVDTQTILSS